MNPQPRARPKRKSRGRGLRVTTGCIICKRRHIKCDETRPQCSPCKTGNRSCIYSHDSSMLQTASHASDSAGNRVDEENSAAAPLESLSQMIQHRGSIQQARSGSGTEYAIAHNTEDNATPLTSITLSTSPLNSRQFEGHGVCGSTSSERPEDRNISRAQGSISVADATDANSWTLERPITLLGMELHLFRHFVEVVSRLLDLNDPEIHFARIVPHLAVVNIGLMKALLALSARHYALEQVREGALSGNPCRNGDVDNDRDSTTVRSLAKKYYADSLHYLESAIHHPSHTQSLDLVIAATLISTYEMIDDSTQDWKRRIQAVFWIQQFQDIDGECKGLRSALWWAWLQQDTWSALLERRRIFSMWKPERRVGSLTAPELARYAWYLLGQCVNYVSQKESQNDYVRCSDRGDELLQMLKEWREALPPEYDSLPLTSEEVVFPAIWVNPTSYAVALQIHSLSIVLVVLHHPELGSTRIVSNRRPKGLLAAAVSTICGIARSGHADDLAANLVSMNCLYEVAICLHDEDERLALLNLLDLCQQRLRWPKKSLRKELELFYSKNAFRSVVK